MITLRLLTAALATLAPLTLSAQAQTQRTVLSGSTQGLAWSVYGPGQLGSLERNDANLRVSAHPDARVLGVKYDDRTIILAMRVAAPIATVYTYHDEQLRQQGFERTSQSLDSNNGRAVYTRGNDTLELRLAKQPNNVYRATFNLTGVQAGNGTMAGGQMQMNTGNDTIRLAVPTGAAVVASSREDEDILMTVRSNLSLAQMDAFYRELFTQQGFTRRAGADAEADKVSAVYVRGESRIEWSAERESADTYQVVFNFEGVRDGNVVAPPTPLAAGAVAPVAPLVPIAAYPYGAYRYEFYGPYRLGAATTANVVRLATPPGSAQDVEVNREGGGVRVLFEANMTLPEVYNFYVRQFADQNFSLVGDRKAETDKIAATFRRGNETVGFNVEREGGTPTNTNYDVFFDFVE